MTDPQTPEQWQEAIDAADFLILVDAAVQYGLVEMGGGGAVNVDRCLDILLRGAEMGIYPSEAMARRRAIGRWLRHERAALGLTQRDMGAACGLSQAWIARLESGEYPVRADALDRLRKAIERLKQGGATT